MNTATKEPADAAANAVYLYHVLETKYCSTCSNEIPVQNDSRRTSFGLNLCDDCLYS